MAQPEAQVAASGHSHNGAVDLERRLRQLLGEQHRLRDALDGVNAVLHRVQDDYCSDPARQEEYDSAIERILGFDPRIDLNEVQEVLAGKRGCDLGEFIDQLERTGHATEAPDAP
jgi:hypothetical protein